MNSPETKRYRRRDSYWWPVSPARKRKLQKRGVLCRYSVGMHAYVRKNPMPHFEDKPYVERP